ncbi:MAG: ATP-binding cassette domain-containing protein [Chloroflexia bacterium]
MKLKLRTRPRSQASDDPHPIAVKVENVERSFRVGGQSVHALTGVDMEVTAGRFVALMGRSGSGKTTLLNMIGGLDQPTSGEVYINGRPLSRLSENKRTELRREEFGFVFQSFALLPILSAAENVELPLRIAGGMKDKDRRKRVSDALALVDSPSGRTTDRTSVRRPATAGGDRAGARR